jgi:dTDP-glucose 4,6-dehydratase
LLDQGDEVVCLDNFSTGSRDNVTQLEARPGFSLIEHDIVEPYVPFKPVDLVMHLASPASPPQYLARPIQTLKVGSAGTINALDIASSNNAGFLLASTSEIYGDPEVNPQPESYRGNVSCTGPRSVYDEAKRFAEAVTAAYRRTHEVDARIARIFNTYGPRLGSSDGRVVSNFIVQALRGEALTVYGAGTQTRSLCYVDDLVEGLLALVESDETEPVNLGNPDERSVLDIAEVIIDLTHTSSKIVYKSLPEDDPLTRCPDITRARGVLRWEPKVPLEDGLQRTIDWFRSVLG